MPIKSKGQFSNIQSSQKRETLPDSSFMNNVAMANGEAVAGARDTNSKNTRNITKSASAAGVGQVRTGNL